MVIKSYKKEIKIKIKAARDIGSVISALEIFDREYLSNSEREETKLRKYAREVREYFEKEKRMYEKGIKEIREHSEVSHIYVGNRPKGNAPTSRTK